MTRIQIAWTPRRSWSVLSDPHPYYITWGAARSAPAPMTMRMSRSFYYTNTTARLTSYRHRTDSPIHDDAQ